VKGEPLRYVARHHARDQARPTAEERFLARISRLPSGCWAWDRTDANGYGRLNDAGIPHLAHRWSYARFVSPLALGDWVLHHCDNRACVNPEHLFVGDHRANMADMVAKGRQKGGLTWDIVRAIRSASTGARGEQRGFARRYGLTTNQVNRVLRGRTWKE
jgi:HNH endonuclease